MLSPEKSRGLDNIKKVSNSIKKIVIKQFGYFNTMISLRMTGIILEAANFSKVLILCLLFLALTINRHRSRNANCPYDSSDVIGFIVEIG